MTEPRPEADLPPDPMTLFGDWMAEAEAKNELPNAMALATSRPDGRPSNRFVLLKGADERGFAFFSNYESRKGGELHANPYAAIAIFWAKPRRQVRAEGRVVRMSAAESDAYFESRDRLSQLGATVSPQSRVIASRAELDSRVAGLEQRLEGRSVPRPAHWGGYRLAPEVVEFWIGRENRLHDRFRYRRAGDYWIVERLAP